MAHVQVTIAGRSYRMACGDGEEAHLTALAGSLDAKIGEMRASFGEIGDMRLHVMAALMVSDELAESRRRIEALEGEIAAIKAVMAADAERADKAERMTADTLIKTAERVERMTKGLATFARAGAPEGE